MSMRRISNRPLSKRRVAKQMVQFLLLAFLAAAASRAADEPFIGKWKLNPSKSKLADQMTIAPAGENKFTLTFAGTGTTETVVADGTDQPGISGTTISITVAGPSDWKIVRKQGGSPVLTALWKLSGDGKSLTDTFMSNRPDGTTSRIDLVYKRADDSANSGDSGIPGTWETTEEKVESVYELEIRPYQGDGLSLINSDSKSETNLKLDGKDYPRTGGTPGAVSSARRVNDHAFAVTLKSKDKILLTYEIAISPDLKTLTQTIHLLDLRAPNILVFDRE